LPLDALPQAACDMHSTLVVPPSSALQPDEEVRERLRELDGLHCPDVSMLP
jgi:hypothetical protein